MFVQVTLLNEGADTGGTALACTPPSIGVAESVEAAKGGKAALGAPCEVMWRPGNPYLEPYGSGT